MPRPRSVKVLGRGWKNLIFYEYTSFPLVEGRRNRYTERVFAREGGGSPWKKNMSAYPARVVLAGQHPGGSRPVPSAGEGRPGKAAGTNPYSGDFINSWFFSPL